MSVEESNGFIARRADQVYRSFLVRCWQEIGADPGGEPAWRFTLVQFDHNQVHLAFADLEALVAHLRQELE